MTLTDQRSAKSTDEKLQVSLMPILVAWFQSWQSSSTDGQNMGRTNLRQIVKSCNAGA